MKIGPQTEYMYSGSVVCSVGLVCRPNCDLTPPLIIRPMQVGRLKDFFNAAMIDLPVRLPKA